MRADIELEPGRTQLLDFNSHLKVAKDTVYIVKLNIYLYAALNSHFSLWMTM